MEPSSFVMQNSTFFCWKLHHVYRAGRAGTDSDPGPARACERSIRAALPARIRDSGAISIDVLWTFDQLSTDFGWCIPRFSAISYLVPPIFTYCSLILPWIWVINAKPFLQRRVVIIEGLAKRISSGQSVPLFALHSTPHNSILFNYVNCCIPMFHHFTHFTQHSLPISGHNMDSEYWMDACGDFLLILF